MSVRIGWWLERPKPPSMTGRRLGVFDYFKVTKGSTGRMFAVGLVRYRRSDLELLRSNGYRCDLRIFGALAFASDVTPRLVDETIGRVHVTGPVFAGDEVKRALRAAAHSGNGSSSDAST